MPSACVTEREVAEYLKAREVGELHPLTVSSAHGMISSPLTPQTKVLVITEEARFTAAKEIAQGLMNNMAYDRVRNVIPNVHIHQEAATHQTPAAHAGSRNINEKVEAWSPAPSVHR